ncbi:MFS transporter [Catenulispora pinisilvae]|uniref:MFS transporter n=1 Tax=Catenulispora pinisilvae TaxID=2705253 RepID=UPI001E3711E7|nr:MFS transporter [Catenulispora pinisilvae]
MTSPEQNAQENALGNAQRNSKNNSLPRALLLIGVVMAVVGSVGGPLITSVATTLHVSLAAAQWTLTVSLLTGAVSTPVLGRLGSGARRRPVVLGTLGVIVGGSVLTVLPLPLGVLLVGRAAQGCGLALGPLMMASAREHLDQARAASTIAMISVASTAGVGFGYPLAGYLTDVGGIRLAYAAALGLAALAFLAALRFFPASSQPVAPAPDAAASLLLTASVLVLLLVLGEASLWQHHLALAVGGIAAGLVLLGAWALRERSLSTPLVDLRLLRHRAVAGANAAMLVAGVGMYLLLSCITRYVQTPRVAGYGFGLSTFTAGLFLVPFSVVGFVAGRLSPWLRARVSAAALVTAATAVVIAAFAVFAVARGTIAGPLVSMTLLGLGVGAFSAAMPAVILEVTPARETASAMGVNQVVRSIGFSLGSTLSALLLAAHTSAGAVFPSDEGFTAAAWIGAAVTALALGVSFTLRPRRAVVATAA